MLHQKTKQKKSEKHRVYRTFLASPAGFERAAFRLGVRPEVAFLVINKFKYRQNDWFFLDPLFISVHP